MDTGIRSPALIPIALATDKLAEMLDRTKWAGDFSWPQMRKLAEYMRAYSVTKGSVIFTEGSIDQALGVIVRGSIDIVKEDAHKGRAVIASLMASQAFGEMSLIDGEPRSANVIAATDVELLLITRDGFSKLSESAPLLALKLLWKISAMISQRLRKTSGHLAEFMHGDASQTAGNNRK